MKSTHKIISDWVKDVRNNSQLIQQMQKTSPKKQTQQFLVLKNTCGQFFRQMSNCKPVQMIYGER